MAAAEKHDPRKSMQTTILARKDSFAQVLPKHMGIDRFAKLATAAVVKNDTLALCTPESMLMALSACAELGLEPNTPLGHAYLIPYDNNKKDRYGNWHKVLEVQFIIGFKGLLALARRSGEIASVSVRVVQEKDFFKPSYGDDEKIIHEPYMGVDDPGAVVAAYMIAKLKDGSIQREVMRRCDIDKIRAKVKGSDKDKSPWVNNFDEMARKTVFRRGWKYLPQSTEMSRAQELDGDTMVDITPPPPMATALPGGRADALAKRLEMHHAPVVQTTANGDYITEDGEVLSSSTVKAPEPPPPLEVEDARPDFE